MILSKVTVEAFFHGNLNQSDAAAAKDLILKSLNASSGPPPGIAKKKIPTLEVTQIPSRVESLHVIVPSMDPTEPNTAVEVYFQVGKDDMKNRVVIDVLQHMMEEPIFDELRTKEQFGYSVSCGVRWSFGVLGMSFQVVTSSKSAVREWNLSWKGGANSPTHSCFLLLLLLSS